MKYLIWENENGWHLSRRDGKIDDNTLNCQSGNVLEKHCKTIGLEYEIKPMDKPRVRQELDITGKV